MTQVGSSEELAHFDIKVEYRYIKGTPRDAYHVGAYTTVYDPTGTENRVSAAFYRDNNGLVYLCEVMVEKKEGDEKKEELFHVDPDTLGEDDGMIKSSIYEVAHKAASLVQQGVNPQERDSFKEALFGEIK